MARFRQLDLFPPAVEPVARPERPAAEPPEPAGLPPPRSELPADVLAACADIGFNKILHGATKFTDWSKQMIEELGEDFRPFAGQVWDASNKLADDVIEKGFPKAAVDDANNFAHELGRRMADVSRPAPPESPDGAQSTTIRGEGIRRSPVSSSAFRSVGYDERHGILEIEFTNGTVNRYFDVPAEVYRGLMAAESHGRYFHKHVCGAGFRHEGARAADK